MEPDLGRRLGAQFIDTGGAFVHAAYYGVRGDGSALNDAALADAMADCARRGRRLYLPQGEYLISAPLVLPDVLVGREKTTPFALSGEWMNTLYKGRMTGRGVTPPGTVIRQTRRDTPALATSPLRAPDDRSPHWHNWLLLEDLYLLGPHEPGDGPGDGTAGVDLQGLFFARLNNLHAEGFRTGIRVRDGSEIWFGGITMAQNNYRGVVLRRQPAGGGDEYDMQAWFDNLVTVNNQENLYLDNPRSVWVHRGENISFFGPTAPRRRVQIVNCNNSQIHLRNYVLESHADGGTPLAPIWVDRAGVGILDIEALNYETAATETLVECAGDFDLIRIARSALPPRLRVDNVVHEPLVSVGGSRERGRKRKVELVDNTPDVGALWVSDGAADPLTDHAPAGFVQLCGRPEMDQGNDNRVGFFPGNQSFTAAGALTGRGRVYWPAGTGKAAAVEIRFPRPVHGPTLLYLTVTLDDDGGSVVPTVDTLRTPAGPVSRFQGDFRSYVARLGARVVGGRTFRKYAITVELGTTPAMGAGVTAAVVAGIHAGGPASGVEACSAYADGACVGPVFHPPRARSAAPGPGDGVHAPGDTVLNAAPAVAGAPGQRFVVEGWTCVEGGVPGVWVPRRAPTGT
jgi:hypothetical protein